MISKVWTWITFNIPFMWELDGYMRKRTLKRLKRKYIKKMGKTKPKQR